MRVAMIQGSEGPRVGGDVNLLSGWREQHLDSTVFNGPRHIHKFPLEVLKLWAIETYHTRRDTGDIRDSRSDLRARCASLNVLCEKF